MNQDPYIYSINKSKATVFTPVEMALLWSETDRDKVHDRLRYYKKANRLIQIKRGFYAQDDSYNKFEFATKQYKPSYISLNTVLTQEGVIFKYYETIYICSYLSRDIKVDNQNYRYKKLADEILLNPKGLIEKEFYFQASKERAFLDAIYLYKDYYFDNTHGMDWDKCFDLVEIYFSKSTERRLNHQYKCYKEDLR